MLQPGSQSKMTSNRSVSAAIGEYLVLGELLKRGAEAYLAHGEGQKGWDIVLLLGGKIKRIQVKTIDWPKYSAVNGNLTSGFDYLVVVLLDRANQRSRFFIFKCSDFESLISPVHSNRLDGKRTLTMSKKSIEGTLASKEDDWPNFV